MDSLIQSFGVVVAFAALIGIFMIVVREDRRCAQKLESARRTYAASLDALHDDPHSSNLRKRALQLGREYAYLMREDHGYSDFDETNVAAEIDAAREGETADHWISRSGAHPLSSIHHRPGNPSLF